MIKLVTTYLVVLSSRFYFWKNRLRQRTTRRIVAGSRFKTLRKTENWVLKTDSLNFVTKWQDGPSQVWRTVIDSSEKLSFWTLWRAAGRNVAGATGHHRLQNPSLGRISLHVLRDVFDYSYFNYKVRGLMLISLITWGLKEVTLS